MTRDNQMMKLSLKALSAATIVALAGCADVDFGCKGEWLTPAELKGYIESSRQLAY